MPHIYAYNARHCPRGFVLRKVSVAWHTSTYQTRTSRRQSGETVSEARLDYLHPSHEHIYMNAQWQRVDAAHMRSPPFERSTEAAMPE